MVRKALLYFIDHGKKGDSLDNDGEQASSHHSSTNSLPPISMETTEKDGEDEGLFDLLQIF